MVTTIFDDPNLISWIWIVLSVFEVACIAGGIVSTREAASKHTRSREENGGDLFKDYKERIENQR